MVRQTLFFALSSLLALSSALAAEPVLRGTVTREQCVDDGNPFSQGSCKKMQISGDNSCIIQIRKNADRSLGLVQIKINAMSAMKDRSNPKVNLKFSGPFMVKPEGSIYLGNADKKTSAEIMTSLTTGLPTKANVYTKHVTKENHGRTTRTYVQYSCRNLRVSR